MPLQVLIASPQNLEGFPNNYLDKFMENYLLLNIRVSKYYYRMNCLCALKRYGEVDQNFAKSKIISQAKHLRNPQGERGPNNIFPLIGSGIYNLKY